MAKYGAEKLKAKAASLGVKMAKISGNGEIRRKLKTK